LSEWVDTAGVHTTRQVSQQLEAEKAEITAELEAPRWSTLLGGGTAGNEHLTSITGALLIVLLAVLGITIIRVGQLIWLHLFLGLVLLGPVAVKLASTGYRFARYYTRNPAYRSKGPPEAWLRALAPLVVASTLVVFVSGVLLLIAGPASRDQYLLMHKASFIVWLAATAVHVLGHLPALGRALRPTSAANALAVPREGTAGRWLIIVGGLAGGVILALTLIPQFAPWTAHGASWHGH
jgi:hypothetical protein